MEPSIGLNIWIMLNNKPFEVEISKIITSEYIITETENRVIKEVKIYASSNLNYLHEYEINSNEIYTTKNDLMTAVFN